MPNLEVYAGTHTKDGHDQKLDINAQRKKVSKFCMHPKWDDVEVDLKTAQKYKKDEIKIII